MVASTALPRDRRPTRARSPDRGPPRCILARPTRWRGECTLTPLGANRGRRRAVVRSSRRIADGATTSDHAEESGLSADRITLRRRGAPRTGPRLAGGGGAAAHRVGLAGRPPAAAAPRTGEAITRLALLTAWTERVRVGTAILLLPLYHPVRGGQADRRPRRALGRSARRSASASAASSPRSSTRSACPSPSAGARTDEAMRSSASSGRGGPVSATRAASSRSTTSSSVRSSPPGADASPMQAGRSAARRVGPQGAGHAPRRPPRRRLDAVPASRPTPTPGRWTSDPAEAAELGRDLDARLRVDDLPVLLGAAGRRPRPGRCARRSWAAPYGDKPDADARPHRAGGHPRRGGGSRLQEYVDAGVRHVIISPATPENSLEVVTLAAQEVLPQLDRPGGGRMTRRVDARPVRTGLSVVEVAVGVSDLGLGLAGGVPGHDPRPTSAPRVTRVVGTEPVAHRRRGHLERGRGTATSRSWPPTTPSRSASCCATPTSRSSTARSAWSRAAGLGFARRARRPNPALVYAALPAEPHRGGRPSTTTACSSRPAPGSAPSSPATARARSSSTSAPPGRAPRSCSPPRCSRCCAGAPRRAPAAGPRRRSTTACSPPSAA